MPLKLKFHCVSYKHVFSPPLDHAFSSFYSYLSKPVLNWISGNDECQMSSNHSYSSSEKGANTGEVGEVSWEELGLEPVLQDGLVYFPEY